MPRYPHFRCWFIGKWSFQKQKISLMFFSHTHQALPLAKSFQVTKMQTHKLQYQSSGQSDNCIASPTRDSSQVHLANFCWAKAKKKNKGFLKCLLPSYRIPRKKKTAEIRGISRNVSKCQHGIGILERSKADPGWKKNRGTCFFRDSQVSSRFYLLQGLEMWSVSLSHFVIFYQKLNWHIIYISNA